MFKLRCKRHYRNLAIYSWCTTWREHVTKTAPARRRHSVGGGGGAAAAAHSSRWCTALGYQLGARVSRVSWARESRVEFCRVSYLQSVEPVVCYWTWTISLTYFSLVLQCQLPSNAQRQTDAMSVCVLCLSVCPLDEVWHYSSKTRPNFLVHCSSGEDLFASGCFCRCFDTHYHFSVVCHWSRRAVMWSLLLEEVTEVIHRLHWRRLGGNIFSFNFIISYFV